MTFTSYAFGLDKNECATNNGGCDAIAVCVNNVGSFACLCPTGYTTDGLQCKGKALKVIICVYVLSRVIDIITFLFRF